jgi:hypothetical protein
MAEQPPIIFMAKDKLLAPIVCHSKSLGLKDMHSSATIETGQQLPTLLDKPRKGKG